jgi:diketogulonate reductase-like aldo/keto reductase
MNFCKVNGIAVTAWGPLGRGKILEDETISKLANLYNKTAAQIILRWHYQNDVITIPKSVKPSRIEENMNIFDFELTQEDIQSIDELNKDFRTGKDPDHFHFDF